MINTDEEYEILEEAIRDKIFKLASDPQGTYVLQKLIVIDSVSIRLIDNLFEVWKDTKGLSVIKRIIAIAKENIIEYIKNKVVEDLVRICQSNFGQYIIQQILESWEKEDTIPIFEELQKNMSILVLNKFSNLVLEKWKEKASHDLISKYLL